MASRSAGFSSRFIGMSTEPRFDTIVQAFNCPAPDFPGSGDKLIGKTTGPAEI